MTADLKFAPTMPAKRAKSHGFLPPAKPFTVRDSNQGSLILLGRYKKRRLWLNVDCRFCPGDDGDLLLRDQGIGTPAETNLHMVID